MKNTRRDIYIHHCSECDLTQKLRKTVWSGFQKLKTELRHDSAILLQANWSKFIRAICNPVFISVLFRIDTGQPSFPHTVKWRCTGYVWEGIILPWKGKKCCLFYNNKDGAIRHHLKSLTQKDKCHIFSFACRSWKNWFYKNKIQKSGLEEGQRGVKQEIKLQFHRWNNF